MVLHITFFTEFPYTREVLEHNLLLNGIAEYVVRGQIGQCSLVLPDEDRYYGLQVIHALQGLHLISRIQMRTRQEGDYDRL